MTWEEGVLLLQTGLDLSPAEISLMMQRILEGRAEVDAIKEFLLALKSKGESAE